MSGQRWNRPFGFGMVTLAASALLAVSVIPALVIPASAAPLVVAPLAAAGPSRTLVLEVASLGSVGTHLTVASARSLSPAERSHLGNDLRPSVATVRAVESEVRAAGLTVVAASQWSVTAKGPRALVGDLVGTGSPVVPSSWQPDVAQVIDSADAAGSFIPHGVQAFGDLTTSYGGGTPSSTTPTLTAATPVIASLQLSGWDSSDLTAFASSVFADSTYDPVASGQFTEVDAGRTSAYTSADGDGYGEVDLDQETLLAAAPELKQRAYFAVNSSAGYLAGLQAVYNDAVSGVPIVALTTSWGGCETASSSSALSAEDGILNKLNALGISVFAASGDSGIYDCTSRFGQAVQGVDFPASDPNVVGVGATTHSNGAAAPAPDTVWSQPGQGGLLGLGGSSSESGSGGGESVVFARPSYQNSATSSAGRAVPDVAVDGDPATGVSIVSTDPSSGSTANEITGGTSLSAPLLAAMIASSAARHPAASGAVVGYGDIHSTIYAHPEAFTDVVAVTSDYGESDDGFVAEPAAGYDESSGLGTPRIDVLDGLLSAARTPTVIAAATSAQGPTVTVTGFARPSSRSASTSLTWRVTGGSAPVTGVSVTISQGAKRLQTKSLSVATRSLSLTLPPGTSLAAVTVTSALGSSTGEASLVVPFDDRAATARRGWIATRDKGAYDGTLSVSSTAGRVASLREVGRTIRVTVRTGPGGGLAAVRVDGRLLRTINTYAAKTHENVTTLLTVSRSQAHTVTVTVLGRHGAHARGNSVALDAVSIA